MEYEGNFVGGLFHGFGELKVYSSPSLCNYYSGEFKHGKKDGKGILKYNYEVSNDKWESSYEGHFI